MAEKIVALPGDGIGEEVVAEAVRVLERCAHKSGIAVDIEKLPIGGKAIDDHGEPLPEFVLESCKKARAVLLGAVGAPRFDNAPPHLRPEKALLSLRSELELYANLRPVTTFVTLLDASPLKRDVVKGVDILIIRELTGGIYFGEPRGNEHRENHRIAYNTEIYSDNEIDRIARIAFEAAALRRKKVTSVDKSNVLESSQLWRAVVTEVAADYPEIELEHILIDNCAMQLIAQPRRFDVLLTNNIFGDILSDEAAMLTGSIGMLPSASLGERTESGRIGLYEPVHGSAPDIAGQNKANPLATIASVALLFRYSLNRSDVAEKIETSIASVLEEGYRTIDIATSESRVVGTREMTEQVLARL